MHRWSLPDRARSGHAPGLETTPRRVPLSGMPGGALAVVAIPGDLRLAVHKCPPKPAATGSCDPWLRPAYPQREECLQVKSDRPQGVRSRPACHELQVTIHEPVTHGITDLAQPRRRPHHLRKAHHDCFPSSASQYATKITRVLSVRRYVAETVGRCRRQVVTAGFRTGCRTSAC